MIKKHITELLIEASKKISNLIDSMQNTNIDNNNKVIESVNDVIRKLDEVVERLEKNKS